MLSYKTRPTPSNCYMLLCPAPETKSQVYFDSRQWYRSLVGWVKEYFTRDAQEVFGCGTKG